MNIKHVELQHYTQDSDSIDWFEVDGISYGISERAQNQFVLIDCDGCPIDLPNADDAKILNALIGKSEYFNQSD